MPDRCEACDGSKTNSCPLHPASVVSATSSSLPPPSPDTTPRRNSMPLPPTGMPASAPSLTSRSSSVYCNLSASHFLNDKTLLDEAGRCRGCKRAASEHSLGDYSCKICTFVNPIDQSVCGVCGTPQYADESPRRMGRAAAMLNNSLDLASFPIPKRPSRKPPSQPSRSPSTSPVSNRSSSISSDNNWIQADANGLWMCPRCSQKNLPLTSVCEICSTSRSVAQGLEESTPQKLLLSLAEVVEPRKDWSALIAQRLLNFEELVVNGSHTFRLIELEVCFSSAVEPKTGQWFFQQGAGDNREEVAALGLYFGMGSIVFTAIQENEPCRCDKKAAACIVCNAITEGAAEVASKIMGCGITHTLLQDLQEVGLAVNVPNEFLCLRSYVTSLGRELNFSFHVTSVEDNGISNDNIERIRYYSLGAEMSKRQLIRDMYMKHFSVREIAEKVGKSPQEVSSLLPKTAPSADPADDFKRGPRLSAGEGTESSFIRPSSGSIGSFGERLGMAKLCESPVNIQASMLATFFDSLYANENPTRWSAEIARNVLFAISRVGTKIPQAILYGERDSSIHDMLPKDQRKRPWLRLLMPLFTVQEAAVTTKDENATLCEECENSVASMKCEYCGVFCKACVEVLHARGQRRQHSIMVFEPPSPNSLVQNKTSQIPTLAANGQYLAGCVVSWSFINQNVEEFIAVMQEVQAAMESLGWNDVSYEKVGGFLVILLKKISQHIRSFKGQITLEHLDRLLALVNFVEEFCFYSPSFGFTPKPTSGQLALHFTDSGSAAKDVMILFEEILGKQLNVTAENPLSCEPEEYKKRQKPLQNALALFKAGVVWCSSLESELCNASPMASTQYCTAVASLLTAIMQRSRFKKNGSDRKQASGVFMGAVAGCLQKQAEKIPPRPHEPTSWDRVNIEAGLYQLKCGLSSITNLTGAITKYLDLKRVFATGVEKISQQEDKRLDKMVRFEEATQFVRGVIHSQAARSRAFVSEVMSEVLAPLAMLQKDHEKEIANFQAAAQQYRIDTDAQKQKLRSLRETALKCYLELVKVYWNTREKSNPEASKKLLVAKASCLQSFVEFERASAELEKKGSSGLFAGLKAAELRRMTLGRAYLRRYVQALNRLTTSYPASDQLEVMLDSLDVEAELRQFALSNPATEEAETLPLKSVQVLTNKWVEMLPENQPEADEGHSTKEGLLYVGARGKSWEQKTVTLREGTLCHYIKASKRPSLGGFAVTGSSLFIWPPDFVLLGRKGSLFGVLPPGPNRVMFIFQANDEKDKQSWLEALQQQGGVFRGIADHSEETKVQSSGDHSSPRLVDGTSVTTTLLPSLDLSASLEGTTRKQSPSLPAPPRPKLISRITFPDNWTSSKGACQINPEDTAFAIVTRMAAKHGGGPPERYALFHEAEVLDDNLALHSRFGQDSMIALSIKRFTRERKPTAPADAAPPPPPVAKFALPEDWSCRTAACVPGPEDTVAMILAKMILKYGPSVTTPPVDEHVLLHEEEVLAEQALLLPLCEKSAHFTVKLKRVAMKVDESVPPRRTRTRTLSLTAIGGTLSALTARTSSEEVKVPELVMKVACPIHWACSIASYNVYAGETAKTAVRKLAKMYAGDSEKYALLFEDEMVDDETVLASRFKGVVAFSVLPSFGGSWF